MAVPSSHRPSREATAWICALAAAAGLSLTSSFPRPGAEWTELEPRTLVADRLGSVFGAAAASAGAPYLLRECELIPVPDPRELSAVLRGVREAYPNMEVLLSRGAHERGRGGHVVSVCTR